MLPETMFAMEKLAREEGRTGSRSSYHSLETWPSSRLDHLALFVWRLMRH